MLTGNAPFDTEGQGIKDTFDRAKECRYDLPKNLSEEAKDLIKNLLCKDERKRPNMDGMSCDMMTLMII